MGMIINPYRFVNAWTPPNAVLWSYGNNLDGSYWKNMVGKPHGEFIGGASSDVNGIACSNTKYIKHDAVAINNLVAGSNTISGSVWMIKGNVRCYVLCKYIARTPNCWALFDGSNQMTFSTNNYYAKTQKTDLDIGGTNWHHYAMVYDMTSNYLRFYYDGVYSNYNKYNTPEVIVETPSDAHLLSGLNTVRIDDLILSNTAWSDDDVADIYNNSPATHK